MRDECLRTIILVAGSVLTGWIAWSGHVLFLPAAIAFPILWSLARVRWQAAVVSAAYFLAASRGLPQGVANFYGTDLWPGVQLWLIASISFVMVHCVLWTSRDGLHPPIRYLVAGIVMAVPPFGIMGWAHPVTAAGVLFPAWGWWGLAAMAAGLAIMTTRHRPAAAMAMSGLWLWSAASWTAPVLLPSWIGVDLQTGSSLGRNVSFERQNALIDLARGHPSGATVILPESAIGFWTPTVARLWQRGLAETGVTVIAGATIIDESGYDNVLVKISPEGLVVLYRQRMPVPGSMWQPWRRISAGGGGASAYFFANPAIDIAGSKVAPLICYEQLLVWPILQSALHRPDVILAVSNGWWTAGTAVVDIQRASTEAWARLFNLPLVFSVNT
ncbi:conjugal transfer protein TraB [Agrobacterium rhizogenes]|uniref:conjugal transfer protein TraB n=1 Tax=Rhizobium rhizogenes TaxID=359 RepID=UPI0022B73C8A|nr:conjugal transfer protein TraB [Rhizobium rhizogenes]MCZ7450260.1 conjugal transfer protein TraB [Rhizobium rhizogenes]